MKKFLLVLCALLATVVGVGAQEAGTPDVTGKTFTLNCARGYLVGNGTKVAGTAEAEQASAFAIVAYGEQTYLYDATNKAFVVHTTAAQAGLTGNNALESSDDFSKAVTGLTWGDTGFESYPYYLEDSFGNWLNMDGGKNVYMNTWKDFEGGVAGNTYNVTIVDPEFDAAEAIAMLDAYFNPSATVTYVISDESGVVFTSEAYPTTVGSAITSLPTELQRGYCSYEVAGATMEAGENTVNVKVTYSLPFVVSQNFEDAKWYFATIRDTKYLRADENAKDGSGRYQTNSTNGGGNEYKWAFGGNPYEGITVMNRAIGAEKYLYAGEQPEFQPLNAEDIKCFWAVSANGAGFTLRSLSGATLYINDNSNAGNLGYWNSAAGANDGGGRWTITEVPLYDITIAADIENGSVAVPQAIYQAGDVVALDITPADGFRLKSLTVTANDEAVAVADDYTFVMPAAAVTVAAVFDGKVYIETDLTSQFSSLTQVEQWIGASGYTATNFCPAVTTNAGQTVQVCERYVGNCDETGDIFYQNLTGLAEGTYKIELYGGAAYTFGRGFASEAFAEGTWNAGDKIEENTGVVLYAVTSEGTFGGEIPIYYATDFPEGAAVVTLEDVKVGKNGELKIGMSKTSKSTNWHVIQLKGVTANVDADGALAATVAAAQAVDAATIPAALAEQIADAVAKNNKVYDTAEEYQAAMDAINAPLSEVALYAPVTPVLAAAKAILNGTNVVTEEAAQTFAEAIAAIETPYDELTLDAETAKNAGATLGTVVTAWHEGANGAAVKFLESAYGINAFSGDLYINTWSVEGETDGSEFKVPFYEYFVGSGKLAEKTFSTTVEGLKPGVYTATALLRAQLENNVNGIPAGITMDANGGKAVALDADATAYGNLYVKEVTAEGLVGEDGKLVININVAADNNVHWLSFKNVKYAPKTIFLPEPTNLDFAASEPVEVGICTYAKDMAANGTANFGAQAVEGWTVLNQSDNIAPEEGSDSRGALDQKAAGVFEYGTDAWLGGADYKVPAEGPEGTNGKALGLISVWGGDIAVLQYIQEVTLAPGDYVMSVTLQNVAGTNALTQNLIGFIPADGEAYMATNTQYPVGEWYTETIKFSLDEYTNGKISLGFVNGGGSASAPHIFVDRVEIVKEELPVVENIAALKSFAFEENPDPFAIQSADICLLLTDARVTYVGTMEDTDFDDEWNEVKVIRDNVVIEDASGATLIQGSTLGNFVKAGDLLNGKLKLTLLSLSGIQMFRANDATAQSIESLEKTEGVAEPFVLTYDNALEWADNDPEWRYIEIQQVPVTVDDGDIILNVEATEDQYGIFDMLHTLPEDFEIADGDEVNFRGYFYTYGGLANMLVPVTLEKIVPEVQKAVYEGVVEQTLTHPQAGNMGTTLSEQTVTIAAAEEGKVNITFSGFTTPAMPFTFPEFTIEGVTVTETEGVITYAAEGFQVATSGGMMTVYYNGTLRGEKAGEEATPVLKLTLQNAATDVVYFGADQEAIDAYKAEEPVEPLEITLDVERYAGKGYTADVATVDFTEAKEFLGVEELTTNMLRIVNPNGEMISDYAPFDGWFNAEGVATAWGANTAICVKFFQAIPDGKYEICDMNDADEIGKTYTVKWALTAGKNTVIYTINVTFVEKPAVDLQFDDLAVAETTTIDFTSELGKAYEELKADVDIAGILAALSVESLDDVTIYAVQSDGTLDDSYQLGTTDGWRNADGDWQTWGADARFCVKTNFEAENTQIYYVGGMDGQNTTAEWQTPGVYTATFAFVKNGSENNEAVVLKVVLTYTVPVGINGINAELDNATIFDLSGRKVEKVQRGGVYIVNGKKVAVK